MKLITHISYIISETIYTYIISETNYMCDLWNHFLVVAPNKHRIVDLKTKSKIKLEKNMQVDLKYNLPIGSDDINSISWKIQISNKQPYIYLMREKVLCIRKCPFSELGRRWIQQRAIFKNMQWMLQSIGVIGLISLVWYRV